METQTEQEQDREDGKAIIEALEAGVPPDPEVVRRVRERAAAIRAEAALRNGTDQEFAVQILRECRKAE